MPAKRIGSLRKSGMKTTPPWLPSWRNSKGYPSITAPLRQWAWEFLRRNPDYQNDLAQFSLPLPQTCQARHGSAKEGAWNSI